VDEDAATVEGTRHRWCRALYYNMMCSYALRRSVGC